MVYLGHLTVSQSWLKFGLIILNPTNLQFLQPHDDNVDSITHQSEICTKILVGIAKSVKLHNGHHKWPKYGE